MQHDLLERARRSGGSATASGIRRASRRSSTIWRAAAASSTPAGAATRRCEAEIKEQTKATIRVIPDAEFRSLRGADDLHLDRPPGRGRGGVGEGVLTVDGRRSARRTRAAARGRRAAAARRLLWMAGWRSPTSRASSARRRTSTTPTSIRRQFRELDEALAAVPHRICFAVKANSNLGVLRVLRDLGAGADIVSGGEMAPRARGRVRSRPHRVQRRGQDARTSCAAAIAAGIGHVNVESMAELELLARLAARRDDAGAGRHPGQSRRHGRDPPLHLHREARHQVRDPARPGAAGGRGDPGASAARAGRRSRCTSAASSPIPQPFAEGAGRLVDLVHAVRADGTTTLASNSTSAAGSASATTTRRRIAPARFAAALVPHREADRAHAVPRAGALPGRGARACC